MPYLFLQTETALMYDAVHLFAKALHDLDSSQRIDIKPLSCDAVDTWPHGYSLINYMKIVSFPRNRLHIQMTVAHRKFPQIRSTLKTLFEAEKTHSEMDDVSKIS